MNNTIANRFVAVLLIALLSATALAQDISGTWEGVLEVAPDTEITVRFDLSADGSGGYQAVLNSPDTGAIKAVQADSVSFDGAQLVIDVPSLSGSYQGAWSGEGFEGEWQQPGAVLPMNLKPYVVREISQKTIDALLGRWNGPLEVPGGEYNMLFHFAADELLDVYIRQLGAWGDLPVGLNLDIQSDFLQAGRLAPRPTRYFTS